MLHHPWVIVGLAALVAFGIAGLLFSQFSSAAKLRRRRRKRETERQIEAEKRARSISERHKVAIRSHRNSGLASSRQSVIRGQLPIAEKKIVGAGERTGGQIARFADKQDEPAVGTNRRRIGIAVSKAGNCRINTYQRRSLSLQIAHKNIG